MAPFGLPFNLGGVRTIAAWFIATGVMAGMVGPGADVAIHESSEAC